MHNDDELLDDILRHLRSEPVGQMPPQLLIATPAKQRRWPWLAAAAAAVLAASLIAALLLLSNPRPTPPSDPRQPLEVVQRPASGPSESEVVVRPIDLTEPLTQLQSELQSIDAEIARLKHEAVLLDAQRKADQLWASDLMVSYLSTPSSD